MRWLRTLFSTDHETIDILITSPSKMLYDILTQLETESTIK